MEFVMVDNNWKKSRDLALLALASYKGKGISNEDNADEDSLDEENVIDIGL